MIIERSRFAGNEVSGTYPTLQNNREYAITSQQEVIAW